MEIRDAERWSRYANARREFDSPRFQQFNNNMGVWTHIEGEHTSKKASIRKIIDQILDGEDVVGTYEHNKFWVRFEHGGVKAAKSIEKIIAAFKSFDKNARLDLTATIEYSV